jgi:hypothetical protein
MLAAGIAFIVSNRFSRTQRTAIGATLTVIGGISTIPAAMAVFSGRRSDAVESPVESAQQEPLSAAMDVPVEEEPAPKVTRRPNRTRRERRPSEPEQAKE